MTFNQGVLMSPYTLKRPSLPALDTELQREVDRFRWHHQIDFGGGVISKGRCKLSHQQAQAEIYFADDLVRGRSFLDIGCWDGYNSLEAVRRGANRVLATDHFAWSSQSWGERGAFELMRKHLAPSIEVAELDLHELTAQRIGTFDIVLFAAVFYHLRHPFATLERIAPLVTDCLIIETHIDAIDIRRPAMIFYPGSELAGDASNWWGPNPPCVEAMLRDVGFRYIETSMGAVHADRAILRAFR
jgi:tRNA (mo5U34)-methyltransferase